MPQIECKNLKFSYFDRKGNETSKIFENLNAIFPNNKISVLIGDSGSGKSSLLHIISGLNENYEGELLIGEVDARDLSIRKRKVSYITQKIILYPHLTIFDNIASPLKYDESINIDEIYVRVRNIARILGIEHCLSRKPKHLSYGQQQRVMIARAFVKDPEIILLDEAFSGLDERTQDDLIAFIKENKKELNATMIVVTHSYKELISLADQVMILENGEIVSTIKKDEIRDSKEDHIVALKKDVVLEELK